MSSSDVLPECTDNQIFNGIHYLYMMGIIDNLRANEMLNMGHREKRQSLYEACVTGGMDREMIVEVVQTAPGVPLI